MLEKDVILLLAIVGIVILAMIFIRQLYTIAVVGLLVFIPFGNMAAIPQSLLGVPGLNILNLIWVAAMACTLGIIVVQRHKLRLWEYFRGPLIVLLVVYLIAAIRTITDLESIEGGHAVAPDIPFTFNLAGRILDDFVKPAQVALTGWMVLVFLHVKQGKEQVLRGLMITAVLMGVVVAAYYFQGLLERGSYPEARVFVTEKFGYHPNNIAPMALALLLAALFGRGAGAPVLRAVGMFAALVIVAVALSRAVYAVLVLMLVLHYREIGRSDRRLLWALLGVILMALGPLILDRIKFGIEVNSETAGGQWAESRKTDELDVDKISAGRLDLIWRPLFKEIEERPIFGNGLWSIRKSEAAQKGAILTLQPHSSIIEVLVDAGVVGLALIVGALLWMRVKAARFKNELYYWILPFLIIGITVPSYYIPYARNYLLFVFYALYQYDRWLDEQESMKAERQSLELR